MRNRLERNHVMGGAKPAGDTPSPEAVRAALERVVTSEMLRTAPQLIAFLRFVVEAMLRGERERIKGYTIGVEALGRSERFDPQTDPIVRVEGTRLRRAMERYYAGPGARDPVIIELPRGSYVPVFRPRPGAGGPGRLSSYLPAWLRSPPDLRAPLLIAIAVLGLAVAGAAGFGWWSAHDRAGDGSGLVTRSRTTQTARVGNGMPTLSLEPLDVTGTPDGNDISAVGLVEQLRDAFALFDAINIILQPAEGDVPVDYKLAGSIEYFADDTATIRFRLTNVSDGKVVWTQSYDHITAKPDRSAAEEAIVVDLAATLLQPFGVIRAYDRVKQLTTGGGDERYRCVVEASESLRSFDTDAQLRARRCLEELTAADPGFAVGLRYLATIYLREYQFGIGDRPDDPGLLDRALATVRRAIELQPESSRGYHTLASIYFARGEIPQSMGAGDHAIDLNRFDRAAMSDYGGRLVVLGEIDRGMMMLKSAGPGIVRQPTHHFYLFLGYYLQGNLPAATDEANQITNERYSLGLVARALTAHANGDSERARRAIDKLVALRREWRENPRGELKKFFPVPALVERLANDLAAAGLSR